MCERWARPRGSSARREPWPAPRAFKHISNGVERHVLEVFGIEVPVSNAGHDPDGHHSAKRGVVQVATMDQVLDIAPS